MKLLSEIIMGPRQDLKTLDELQRKPDPLGAILLCIAGCVVGVMLVAAAVRAMEPDPPQFQTENAGMMPYTARGSK